MRKVTDLKSIREVAKNLMYAVPITDTFIVSHPFTQSNIVYAGDRTLDLRKSEDFRIWFDVMSDIFDKSTDYHRIYMYVTKPYRLTFLKFTKPFMTKELFAEILKDAYISTEFPNKDKNVPPKDLKCLFRQADKKHLMSKEEYEQYLNFPNTVKVYRGVNSLKGAKGLSWTLNLETARWFSHRFNPTESYVLSAEVPKEKIFAYFMDRNEYEVVVDTTNLKYEVEKG